MCGILCYITYADTGGSTPCLVCNGNQEIQQVTKLLQNRGPDFSFEQCFPSTRSEGKRPTVHLSGHVLWTQGQKLEPQPYLSQKSYLLFNGDIYSFGRLGGIEHTGDNDGIRLFNMFQSSEGNVKALVNSVSSLRGPFAFIYYDQKSEQVWFGRDFFGRESLLLSYPQDQDENHTDCELLISSVSSLNKVFEIPASGLFRLDLTHKQIRLYPWDSHHRDQMIEATVNFSAFLRKMNIAFLTNSDMKVQYIPTCLKNLAANYQSDEILQTLMKCSERVVENEVDALELLAEASEILEAKVEEFLVHLRNSVRLRVETKPPFCKDCIKTQTTCSHSKIGILFSGGLDSMILAFLTAELLGPGERLDLLNVAFFQDAQLDSAVVEASIPDRQTGLEAWRVLSKCFNGSDLRLNFVPINVPKSKVEELRRERISSLISPLKSVLDDSLGCCLWFAAAAPGKLSPARILLLGSGADELLGGYGRHRTAFERAGWSGLIGEMQLELDRISVRNLGRDNRVVSDSGVSPRMPYVDEPLVEFLTQNCDVWTKCCPVGSFGGRGLGEKLLLRVTALKLLGKENGSLALFPKRAMQFGSRIAKLENSKEKGGDSCSRLKISASKRL